MKISTNPFDYSSEEDEDSEGFQDCTDIGSFSSKPKPLMAGDSLFGSDSNESNMKKKRIAPLSFEEKVIVANPALTFGENSTSTSQDHFFSPLESALLANDTNVESSDDEVHNFNDKGIEHKEKTVENEESEPYLSGWVSYLLNSPKKLTGQISSIVSGAEEGDRAIVESTHSFFSSTSRPPSRLDENVVSSSEGSAFVPCDEDTRIEQAVRNDPLAEATTVMERMETVSRSISSIMLGNPPKEKINQFSKKAKAGEEADKKILRTIEDHPRDSDLTMNHNHAGTPWTRLIILEELGTASSWIILLIPYIAFLLALMLDSDTLLWDVLTGPIKATPVCPNHGISHFEQCLMEQKALNDFYPLSKNIAQSEASHSENEAYIVMSTGVITDFPVMSTFLYGDLLMSNLSSTSVSLVSDGAVTYFNVILQQPIGSNPDEEANWNPVSISKPRNLELVCKSKVSYSNETLWNCSSPRNVDVRFSRPDTSILTGGAIRIDTVLSYSHIQHQSSSDRGSHVITGTIVNDLLFHEKQGLTETGSNSTAILSDLAHSTSYLFTHSSSLKPKIVIIVRFFTLIINCGFIVFWFWSMGLNGFFGIESDTCVFSIFRSWGKEEGKSLVKKAEGKLVSLFDLHRTNELLLPGT